MGRTVPTNIKSDERVFFQFQLQHTSEKLRFQLLVSTRVGLSYDLLRLSPCFKDLYAQPLRVVPKWY